MGFLASYFLFLSFFVSSFLHFIISSFLHFSLFSFLHFVSSWFLRFFVSSFIRCFVVLFLRCFVSSVYYKIFISCFQVDIGRISKNFKKFLDWSSWFSGGRLFHFCKTSNLWNFEISKNNIVPKGFAIFLNYLRYPGVSKDKDYWFWEPWTRPEIPKS